MPRNSTLRAVRKVAPFTHTWLTRPSFPQRPLPRRPPPAPQPQAPR